MTVSDPRTGWRRAAAIGGAISVALVVASGVLEKGLPRATASAQTIADYYARHSHWHRIEAGIVVGALSMVFFLWFLATLYERLRTAEGPRGHVAPMALGAGIAFTALFGVLNASRGAIGEVLTLSRPFREGALDPQLVRVVAEVGGLVYVSALVVGAVLIASASAVVVRTRVVAPWVGLLGAVIAAVVLVGAFLVPRVVVDLLLAWVLLLSLTMAVQRSTPAAGAAAPV